MNKIEPGKRTLLGRLQNVRMERVKEEAGYRKFSVKFRLTFEMKDSSWSRLRFTVLFLKGDLTIIPDSECVSLWQSLLKEDRTTVLWILKNSVKEAIKLCYHTFNEEETKMLEHIESAIEDICKELVPEECHLKLVQC